MPKIEDDKTAMLAIACLQNAGYSAEEVLAAMAVLAMADKPAAVPEPEDLPPWPVGTVVRDVKTGYRHVLSQPLLRSSDYEFVCDKPHGEEDPDYSYLCNNEYCRCSC